MAAGDGYLWVTATDAGEVLRIDPATRAIARVHVGGSPVGIAVTSGNVWFADRSDGNVRRLDPGSLWPIGHPIRVGRTPTWLVTAGDSLFATDQDAGTVVRIDARSAQELGPPIRIAPPAKDAAAATPASTGESVWVSSFWSNTVTRITSLSSLTPPSGEITVQGRGNGPINFGPTGTGVTNGSVASTGRFTATGAISDKGTYIDYRRATGEVAKVRRVLVGREGTITIVITIHLDKESPALWMITSGTKRYAGLHATGTETVSNYQGIPFTFVLEGTLSS